MLSPRLGRSPRSNTPARLGPRHPIRAPPRPGSLLSGIERKRGRSRYRAVSRAVQSPQSWDHHETPLIRTGGGVYRGRAACVPKSPSGSWPGLSRTLLGLPRIADRLGDDSPMRFLTTLSSRSASSLRSSNERSATAEPVRRLTLYVPASSKSNPARHFYGWKPRASAPVRSSCGLSSLLLGRTTVSRRPPGGLASMLRPGGWCIASPPGFAPTNEASGSGPATRGHCADLAHTASTPELKQRSHGAPGPQSQASTAC
jgi:hypothetical protein